MKKYLVYFTGLILVSLSISLNYLCHFGSSSVDSLTKNISNIINMYITTDNLRNIFTTGNILIVANLLFVLVYFIITKSKDIILPIIISFSMGFLVNLFNHIPVGNHIAIRVIVFILSLNIMSLGVSLMIHYNFSPSPFECVTILATKAMPKLSYGICKMIVELITIAISATLALIFMHNLGEVNFATIIIFLVQGPLIDVYNKLLKKVKFLN